MPVTVITGINHPLRDLADKETDGSVRFLEQWAARDDSQPNYGNVHEFETLKFMENLVGGSLWNAAPTMTRLHERALAEGAVDEETAIDVGFGRRAFALSVGDQVQGVAVMHEDTGHATFMTKDLNGKHSVQAARWSRSSGDGQPDLNKICNLIVSRHELSSRDHPGYMSLYTSEGDHPPYVYGRGRPENWFGYAEATRPLLDIPVVQRSVNMQGPSFVPASLALDGGFSGPVCQAVYDDLKSLRNGYAMVEAASKLEATCAALLERGNAWGISRLAFCDMDIRAFAAESDDGRRVAMAYENIDYIDNPKHFLLVGTRAAEGGLESIEICPVLKRSGLSFLMNTFKAGKPLPSVGGINLVTGLVDERTWSSPNDSVERACFGVDVVSDITKRLKDGHSEDAADISFSGERLAPREDKIPDTPTIPQP